MATVPARQLIEGNPVLVVVDIQGGGAAESPDEYAIPLMPGYGEAMDRAPALIAKARECGIPKIGRAHV